MMDNTPWPTHFPSGRKRPSRGPAAHWTPQRLAILLRKRMSGETYKSIGQSTQGAYKPSIGAQQAWIQTYKASRYIVRGLLMIVGMRDEEREMEDERAYMQRLRANYRSA